MPAKLLSVEEVKTIINRGIDVYLKSREVDAKKVDEQYKQLIVDLGEFIQRGGKRMRPYLGYLAYVGSGGTNIDDFLEAAVSLELLHNFLLIHDDIIDRDYQRYGGLNIAGTYKRQFGSWLNETEASHLSGSTALLAGDVDAVMCSDVVLKSKFSDSIKLKILKEMYTTIFIVGGGEYLDTLAAHSKNVDELYLEKVYECKSAIYSIEMPLRFGAIAAGNEASFYNFSSPIGIAFQLVDDLLGMFGDEQKIGKPVLSDLHEGKKTVLMIKALELASPVQKKTLLKYLGNNKATFKDLEMVREILNETGAHDYVKHRAQENLSEALEALKKTNLSSEVKNALGNLSEFIISRNH